MSGAFESIDVAVIGGGLSGLTAAYHLKKAHCRVVVLETSPVFGGCAGSVRSGPYVADMGPQSIIATPAVADLVRELGLDEQFLRADAKAKRRYIFRHGRLIPVPISPGEFIATPLLSAAAKWRLFAEPWIPGRTDDADESIASFVARRGGPELVDALVAPVVSGIYAGDPAKLSVRSTMPALVRLEQEHAGVLRGLLVERFRTAKEGAVGFTRPRNAPAGFVGGNATLIDALVDSLQGSTYAGVRVKRLSQRGAGFALECEGLPERSIEAARVVIATPSTAAAELVEALEPDAARDLRAIEHPPIAQVVLAYPRSHVGGPLDGFGFLACRDEGVRILGAVWNSALFRGRCPDDEVLLTAFLGGATDPEVAQCSDQELAQVAHSDVVRVMKIDAARPKVVAGFRWAGALPQYALGHDERIGRVEAAVARIPGLFLLGNYLHGPSVADRIGQGKALADGICVSWDLCRGGGVLTEGIGPESLDT